MKAKPFKLKLEVNQKFIDGDDNKVMLFGKIPAMITPPLDEDYWQFRVMVNDEQAIVGFPKFNTIGIGFAKEDDWNTNLPYNCNTETIWQHIKVNKYFASIPEERCLKAIKMVQDAATEMKKAEQEIEDLTILSNEPMLQNEKGNKQTLKQFIAACKIKYERRAETFVSPSKHETKKRLYCLLFGFDAITLKYKYKMSGYFLNENHAHQAFYAAVQRYNLNGDMWTGDRWISFKVAANSKEGFEITKKLPHPIFD